MASIGASTTTTLMGRVLDAGPENGIQGKIEGFEAIITRTHEL
jgi:hypothetical protein